MNYSEEGAVFATAAFFMQMLIMWKWGNHGTAVAAGHPYLCLFPILRMFFLPPSFVFFQKTYYNFMFVDESVVSHFSHIHGVMQSPCLYNSLPQNTNYRGRVILVHTKDHCRLCISPPNFLPY